MGKILDRLISWFVSVLIVIFLIVLVALGWYNYVFGGVFLVIGVVLAFFSVRQLAKAIRGKVAITNPDGKPYTSRKQTAICLVILLIGIVFLTLGALALAGYIELGLPWD